MRSIIKILPRFEAKVGLPIECVNLFGLFADLSDCIPKKKKKAPSYFMEKESNGSY